MKAYGDKEAIGAKDRRPHPFLLPAVESPSLRIAQAHAVYPKRVAGFHALVAGEKSEPALSAEIVLPRLAVMTCASWPPSSRISRGHVAKVGRSEKGTGDHFPDPLSEISVGRSLCH
jgi:hypothetical protein